MFQIAYGGRTHSLQDNAGKLPGSGSQQPQRSPSETECNILYITTQSYLVQFPRQGKRKEHADRPTANHVQRKIPVCIQHNVQSRMANAKVGEAVHRHAELEVEVELSDDVHRSMMQPETAPIDNTSVMYPGLYCQRKTHRIQQRVIA